MLSIKNLHAEIDGKKILKGVDLQVQAGETHIIMGPNGSGKTTLSSVLAGRQEYTITAGEIIFEGDNLSELSPTERSLVGIFLAFQYPAEIPGIANREFLKSIVNAQRKNRGEAPLDSIQFEQLVQETIKKFDLKADLLDRNLNEGFSGGEKKQNEILQMALLNPKLKILDETDSGLDIDALQKVAEAIKKLQTNETSTLIITHYNRLVDLVEPDFVHIMADGKIVESGDKSLAKAIEDYGYDKYLPAAPLNILN
jgi:Fe-S cluster assembly ATP-binding protein